MVSALVLLAGCTHDPDKEVRDQWAARKAADRGTGQRRGLNTKDDVWFYDGWYPVESDPKTGGAWRWQNKRGTVRLRHSSIPAQGSLTLIVYGWTPNEFLDVRAAQLDFYVNGTRIARFSPPAHSFEFALKVPRELLGDGTWVDMNIVAANTARPPGDWRDLGFATTGFRWELAADGPALETKP